jgi:hypothetical protein
MLSAALLLTLSAVQTPAATPNAATAISNMMALYSNAQTISGTIEQTQSADNVTTKIITRLQLDRKGRKLFLRQDKPSGFNAGTYIITADGNRFSYPPTYEMMDRANANRAAMRVLEPMFLNDGTILTEKDAYVAGTKSIPDRSAAIDIAISRTEDLKFIRMQLATLEFIRTDKVGEETVNVFGGKWRPFGEPTGTYEMWVDSKNSLRRYATKESISLAPNTPVVTVITVWSVNLMINPPTLDESLFKVIK